MSPQTSEEGVKRGRPWDSRFVLAGMMMMTMTRARMLKVLPMLLICAMRFVGSEAMEAWMSMRKTERRKVWYEVGTKSGFEMLAAARIMAAVP